MDQENAALSAQELGRSVWVRSDSSLSRGLGGLKFSLMDWMEKPTTTVRVFAGRLGGPEVRNWLALGDTFEVAGYTWRLAELYSPQGGKMLARLRLVDENESDEPLVSNVFETVDFQPYGRLDKGQINALERELGQRLPSSYRGWLEATNGAKPAVPCKLGDTLLALTPSTPLFGWHPDYPPYDLVAAQRRYRDVYFTRNQIVIGATAGAGGLLTVTAGGDLGPNGSVGWLPGSMMAGTMDPLEREKLLRPAGLHIGGFLGVLAPLEIPS